MHIDNIILWNEMHLVRFKSISQFFLQKKNTRHPKEVLNKLQLIRKFLSTFICYVNISTHYMHKQIVNNVKNNNFRKLYVLCIGYVWAVCKNYG